MSVKTFFYLFLISVSLLYIFPGCNGPKPPEGDGTGIENDIDFYITSNDSGLQLTFLNFKADKPDSFHLTLNKQPVAYRVLSDKMLFIPHDSMPAGKNSIDLSYKKNGRSGSLTKIYFHVLNVRYKIVNTYAHNRNYFTQGLLFDENGELVESTGLNGQSKIVFYRRMGNMFKPADSIINPGNEFGEGIAIVNKQLIQLLWQNRYIRLYDKSTKKPLRNLEYPKEGWGICNDGNTIYTSDGSGYIHQVDINGDKASIVKSIQISDENGPIRNINELEFANGLIFANIWQTTQVYIIDPRAGMVVGKIDMTEHAMKEGRLNENIDVLNGVAYNPSKNTYLLTGKYWAHFYEIQLDQNLNPVK